MTSKLASMSQEELAAYRADRIAAAEAERQRKAERIYFHHPKYGRFKRYPTTLTYRFNKDQIQLDSLRMTILNWINANSQGNWSVDDVDKDGNVHIYHLSFENPSDALIFKLVWAHEQIK